MFVQLIRVNEGKLKRNSVPPFNLDFFSYILKSSNIKSSLTDMVTEKLMINNNSTHIIIECYSYHKELINKIIKEIPENIKIFSTGNFKPDINKIINHIKCFDIKSLEKTLDIKLIDSTKDFIPFYSHNFKYKFMYPVKEKEKINWTYTITGSGCPGKCKYCSGNIRKTQKLPIMNRNIQTIINELKYLISLNRKYICFEDDNFLRDKDFITSLLKKILREKIKIKWNCQARADDLNDRELVALMKKSGCIFVRIGCESVSRKILNKIGKGKNYRANLIKTCSLLNEFNIPFNLLIILGLPFDKIKYSVRILSFIIKTNPFLIQLHNFVPYEDSFFGKKLGIDHNLFHYNFFKKSYSHYNWVYRSILFYTIYSLFFFLKVINRDLFKYFIFFKHNPNYLSSLIFGTRRKSL